MGAIKGVYAFQKAILKKRALFSKVSYVRNYYELMGQLEEGDFDSILLSNLAYEYNIPASLKDKLVVIEENLFEVDLCHYINSKHTKYKKALEENFQELQKKQELDILDFYNSKIKS